MQMSEFLLQKLNLRNLWCICTDKGRGVEVVGQVMEEGQFYADIFFMN